MKIIDRVIASRIANRAAKITLAYNILTLLYGELETKVKREGKVVTDVSDAEVIVTIKKLIKSNNEIISLSTEVAAKKFVDENEILKMFLPQEMTKAEIEEALAKLPAFTSIGEAIKGLDVNYAGLYDKGMASQVAKNHLI